MVGRGNAAFGVVLLALLFFVATAAPAAAQADATNESEVCVDAEQVDPTLELCNAEFDDGDAVLTFRSQIPQEVTLSDAGKFSEGGDVPQRDVRLRPNGTQTVRFPVTKTDSGKAGVGISSDRALYSVVLEESRSWIGGPYDANDARWAGGGGIFWAALSTAVTVVRRRLGHGGDPRRLA